MVKTKKLLGLWAVLMLTGSLASCTVEMETDEIDFESGIRLTVIHTGDIHSRLLPYDMDLMRRMSVSAWCRRTNRLVVSPVRQR